MEDEEFEYSDDEIDYLILAKAKKEAKKELERIENEMKNGTSFFEINYNVVSFFREKLKKLCKKYRYFVIETGEKCKMFKNAYAKTYYLIKSDLEPEILRL